MVKVKSVMERCAPALMAPPQAYRQESIINRALRWRNPEAIRLVLQHKTASLSLSQKRGELE
jgi:hypothetical protein